MLHKTTRLGSFEPLRCVVTKRERFLDTLLKPHKSILTSEMQNATPAVFGLWCLLTDPHQSAFQGGIPDATFYLLWIPSGPSEWWSCFQVSCQHVYSLVIIGSYGPLLRWIQDCSIRRKKVSKFWKLDPVWAFLQKDEQGGDTTQNGHWGKNWATWHLATKAKTFAALPQCGGGGGPWFLAWQWWHIRGERGYQHIGGK